MKAGPADAATLDPQAIDPAELTKFIRARERIESLVAKIHDGFTGGADEVMMRDGVGIEANPSEPWAEVFQNPDGHECPKSTIHRIQGNRGKMLADTSKHRLSIGMIFVGDDFPVDGEALMGHLQALLTTNLPEGGQTIFQ